MTKKQNDGRYRAKLLIGYNENNNPVYKYLSAHSKSELQQKKAETERLYRTGAAGLADATFRHYSEMWFEEYKKPHVSVSSAENYKAALNNDILPVFANRLIRSIKTSEIQQFMNGFAGRSMTKLRMLMASFNGVFKLACADNVIEQNPAQFVIVPKASKAEEKRALTAEERKKVEEVCKTSEHGDFLACLYYLGCRQGEARGLKWGDFDWDERLVHIQRDIDNHNNAQVGTVKTASSDRYLPIPDDLKNLLYHKRGESDEFVFKGEKFHKPWSKTVTERIWCELCIEAGFFTNTSNKYRQGDVRSKYKPTITPHILRHNYISMCYDNDVDIYTTMKLAGHKSYKTTMDIYTHLSKKKIKSATEQVNDMFKKK